MFYWVSLAEKDGKVIPHRAYEKSRDKSEDYKDYSRETSGDYDYSEYRREPDGYDEDYSGDAEEHDGDTPVQGPRAIESHTDRAPAGYDSYSRRGAEGRHGQNEGQAYEDTRRAVGSMMSNMSRKRADASCREVLRQGMTCLRCSDAKGVQVRAHETETVC